MPFLIREWQKALRERRRNSVTLVKKNLKRRKIFRRQLFSRYCRRRSREVTYLHLNEQAGKIACLFRSCQTRNANVKRLPGSYRFIPSRSFGFCTFEIASAIVYLSLIRLLFSHHGTNAIQVINCELCSLTEMKLRTFPGRHAARLLGNGNLRELVPQKAVFNSRK